MSIIFTIYQNEENFLEKGQFQGHQNFHLRILIINLLKHI